MFSLERMNKKTKNFIFCSQLFYIIKLVEFNHSEERGVLYKWNQSIRFKVKKQQTTLSIEPYGDGIFMLE